MKSSTFPQQQSGNTGTCSKRQAEVCQAGTSCAYFNSSWRSFTQPSTIYYNTYSEFPPYQEPEPRHRQPPFIPLIGGPCCHMGSKIRSLLTPKIKLCNSRIQWSFCQSVSFPVLKFTGGAVPAAVTSNNIAW